MEQNTAKPPRKKNALNVGKISLSAPNPQVKGVYASLKFGVFNNNPRIVVDTRDPNLLSKENGFGRIEAALSSPDFFAYLDLLEHFATHEQVDKKSIQCFGHDWANGQKSKEITLQSSVWVGRDAEGCIFTSVVSENKKNFAVIKFVFGTSDQRYTKFVNADNTPMTKAQASQLYARAYAKMLRALVPNVLDTHYYEAPPSQWGSGGGGGGYNRGGGNTNNRGGGNYNRGGNSGGDNSAANPEITDDMPF